MRAPALRFAAIAVTATMALAVACAPDHEEEATTTAATAPLTPVRQSGNVACGDLGYAQSIDLADVRLGPGTFSSAGVSVTISNYSSAFDWAATSGIDAVIVRGGPDANVYRYMSPATSDTRVHAPENLPQGQGKFYFPTRVQFCFGVAADGGAQGGEGGAHDAGHAEDAEADAEDASTREGGSSTTL